MPLMGTSSSALFVVTCLFLLTQFLRAEAFCSKYVEPEGYSCKEYKMYTEDGYGILLHRVGTTVRKRPLPNSISASTLKLSTTFLKSPKTAETSSVAQSLGQSESTTTSKDGSRSSSDVLSGAARDPNQAIQHRRGDPVLLLHPEMLNGDSWFKHVDLDADSGRDTALLPFHLVDEGFDVWIGHHRATYWSHDHRTVTHEDPVYWNWTWDELAQYDVPTMVRFVRNETNVKVNVVGSSQSATVAAAAATRRDVGDIIKSLTLIGPTIYRGIRNPLLMGAWARIFSDLMERTAEPSGLFNFSRQFNMHSLSLKGHGAELTKFISGPDCCLSPSLSLFENGWDGTTSLKNVEHEHQAMMTPHWRKFDYGAAKLNFEAYGLPTPPDYEPTDIPADVRMLVLHGGQDLYSPSEGVKEFLAIMLNRPSRVFLPSYAHIDLFFSKNRKDDIYIHISKFLKSNGTD